MKFLVISFIIFVLNLILIFSIVNYINIIEYDLLMKNEIINEELTLKNILNGNVEEKEKEFHTLPFYIYFIIFVQIILILENVFNLTSLIERSLKDG